MELNPNHKELFQSEDEILLVYGGSGAGKTYSIEDKVCLYSMIHRKLNREVKIVELRKSLPSLKRTSWEILKKRLRFHKIDYRENKNDMEIKMPGAKILGMSCSNQYEVFKLQSLTDVDFFHVEEAGEISYDIFGEILRRLRGSDGIYHQLILSFNPISDISWIYKKFWESNLYPGAKKLRYSIEDNIYLLGKDPQYVQRMRDSQFTNPSWYKVYYLGEWGKLEHAVFPDTDIVDSIPNTDDVIYGLDFGFTNPSALLKLSIKDNEVYEEELISEPGLTNPELIEKMKTVIPDPSAIIYCDCAEPDRIKEIQDAGFYNATACKKDKIESDLIFVKSFKIHMLSSSSNLIKENNGYCHTKDRDGHLTESVISINDHLMTARKYALCTHFKGRQSGKPEITFGKIDWLSIDPDEIAKEYQLRHGGFIV